MSSDRKSRRDDIKRERRASKRTDKAIAALCATLDADNADSWADMADRAEQAASGRKNGVKE